MSDNESNELHREGEAAGRRVDAYQATLARIEQDITMIDHDAAMASIAISLKRIADAFDHQAQTDRIGVLSDAGSLKRIADSLDALPDQISNVLFGYWQQTQRGR